MAPSPHIPAAHLALLRSHPTPDPAFRALWAPPHSPTHASSAPAPQLSPVSTARILRAHKAAEPKIPPPSPPLCSGSKGVWVSSPIFSNSSSSEKWVEPGP